MAGFRPFEYMAWSKGVRPGARYVLNVSGLGPPADFGLAVPSWATITAGVEPLRSEFAERLAAWQGAPGRDVVVVSGASEAGFVALASLVGRGDAVVVERPAYAAMERVVRFLGAEPVVVEREARDGWRLDPARLEAALVSSGARVVALTDPHNPTGVSLDAATRAAVLEVLARRDAWLVVDEVFAPFRGSGRAPAWAAQSDRVLSLGSLTKGWGLAGLRTGWVLGAPGLVARGRQVFDLLGVNAPSVTLALASAALGHAEELDARAARASRRVRAAFATAGWGAEAMVTPDDGIIGFLRLPEGWSSEVAVTALRDEDGVQAVPGHFFGCEGYLRLGFDPETTDGEAGCRIVGGRVLSAEY